MLLEDESKKKRVIKKLLIFFSALITMSIICAIPVFAAPIEPLEEVSDGEQAWGWPFDGIYESIRALLFSFVNLLMSSAFDNIDSATSYATGELTQTPSNYGSNGAAIFSVVEAVSKNVILPIATVILTYVVIYEFITMVMDRNNFHDFDTSIFFRWIIKTTVGIYFLTNASTIINAFFDLGSYMATKLTATVDSSLEYGTMTAAQQSFVENIHGFGIGTFISMILPCLLLWVVSLVIFVSIYIIVISRMIEIYLHISVAPIPMATITNREFGESGKNFLKIIFAFVLQAFFMLLCIAIFKTLIVHIAGTIGQVDTDAWSDPANNNVISTVTKQMFEAAAFGICLVLCMFKSNSLAKSILGAH